MSTILVVHNVRPNVLRRQAIRIAPPDGPMTASGRILIIG
jgi:hypothetical protein